MQDDEFFMGLALEEAEKAYQLLEVPVGAVLVSPGGHVLSKAHNMPVSSNDPTAHAEILVLRVAAAEIGNYRLPQTILYVTLEPCAMCVGAMLHARVARMVFGTPDPKTGAAGSVLNLTCVELFNHSIQVTAGVRQAECAKILRNFFKERRDQNRAY